MEIYKTFDKPRVKAGRLGPRIHSGAPARRLREQRGWDGEQGWGAGMELGWG